MLATALRIILLLALALFGALGLHLFALSPLAAALAAVAGVLLTCLMVTLVTFVLAGAHVSRASVTPPLAPWRRMRMMLLEWLAFVANFVLISPFERAWMGDDRLAPPGNGRPERLPLVLVHGYGCSRAAWWWLRRRLERSGWTVATVTLEPIYTDIDNYVAALAQRVDAVLHATGARQVVLVGHSMGGLVIRAWLRRGGAEAMARARQAITLATPYGGSELARLGFGANARQMVPGNDWLQGLATVPMPVDTVAIYSPHDNYVMPSIHLELAGARRRTIAGVGHLALLFSPRVAAMLQDELERSCRLPESS